MCYLSSTVIKYLRRQLKGERISLTIVEILVDGLYTQLLLGFCTIGQSIITNRWSSKVTHIMVARWHRLR